MQLASTGINLYSGSGPAVEQLDVVAYLLATYTTVSEVKADLDAGKMNIVLNPSLTPITQLMFGTNYSMVHFVLVSLLMSIVAIQTAW